MSQSHQGILPVVFRIYIVMLLRPKLNFESSQPFYKCKFMESLICLNNHVVHRIIFLFFLHHLGHWVERYLHYKNATQKKTYFFNQPDQPPGIGSNPWSWATTWWGGRHPAVTFKLHHSSGISMLSQIDFLMFESGPTVQKLHSRGSAGSVKWLPVESPFPVS